VGINSLLVFLPFRGVDNGGLDSLGVGGRCHLQNNHSIQTDNSMLALE